MISLVIAWLIIGMVAVAGGLIESRCKGLRRFSPGFAVYTILFVIVTGPIWYVWSTSDD